MFNAVQCCSMLFSAVQCSYLNDKRWFIGARVKIRWLIFALMKRAPSLCNHFRVVLCVSLLAVPLLVFLLLFSLVLAVLPDVVLSILPGIILRDVLRDAPSTQLRTVCKPSKAHTFHGIQSAGSSWRQFTSSVVHNDCVRQRRRSCRFESDWLGRLSPDNPALIRQPASARPSTLDGSRLELLVGSFKFKKHHINRSLDACI